MLSFQVFLLGQACGIVFLWTAKWLKGEVACVIDMARTELRWTLGSMLTQVIGAVAMFATGMVDGTTVARAFAMGFGGGGLIEAVVNRSRRREWTDGERKMKAEERETRVVWRPPAHKDEPRE